MSGNILCFVGNPFPFNGYSEVTSRFRITFEKLSGSFLLIFVAGVCLAEERVAFSEGQRNHWAFRPVVKSTVPVSAVDSRSPFQNAIDAFVDQKLKAHGARLSHPADARTLLRRITFDVIGLPPTQEDLQDFVNDSSPDAYERVVDRLLANPHFGEAWGRNWLDVVRFAETAGFKEDPIRPFAYTYRDYVIRAFNRDLSFQRFVCDQIAGDELFPDDTESQAATAYCRMWPDESNASNIHLARQSSLDDLTGNVGVAFLGLSVGCAQCHDHKFDPILQTDFYQLQAFFSGIVLEEHVPIGTHAQLDSYRKSEREWLNETAPLRHELNTLERPARYKMQGERRMKFPADVLEALDLPIEDRTTMQRQLAFWSARQMGVKEDDIPKHLDEAANVRRDEVMVLMAEAKSRKPNPPREATVMAVVELTQDPPATYRMENGSYDRPKEELKPHFPAILRRDVSENPPEAVPPTQRSSGRRTVLAQWLASRQNPLTHRVWVNRIWQGHFGKGLVSNANDFGTQEPTPALNDLFEWMTSEFLDAGLQSKRLHRLIVSSATYRQSSNAESAEMTSHEDSGVGFQSVKNRDTADYSCYPRQRLSSERIRDAWLMASGQFNDSLYGPGVRAELPPNFSSYEWKVSEPTQQVRRSVYLFAKRNLPYPMMVAFDFPDMHEACGCRTKTTIAPQALMLLNNRTILKAARQMAIRSRLESTSADPAQTIQQAWHLAFARPASELETKGALQFVADQYQRIVAEKAAVTDQVKEWFDADEEAMTDLCHSLLNTNEFLFVE